MTTIDRDRVSPGWCAVRPGIRHLTSEEVRMEVALRLGVQEISDATAVTIASWWQSPVEPGLTLASLVSGLRVRVDKFLDAVYAAQRELDLQEKDGIDVRHDREALDLLSTWAINGPDALSHPKGN